MVSVVKFLLYNGFEYLKIVDIHLAVDRVDLEVDLKLSRPALEGGTKRHLSRIMFVHRLVP